MGHVGTLPFQWAVYRYEGMNIRQKNTRLELASGGRHVGMGGLQSPAGIETVYKNSAGRKIIDAWLMCDQFQITIQIYL
mgnify:CR=1 FL=1|jgi:hypothetical protein